MTAKAMHITSVRREARGEDPDTLTLKPGVNVVVGPQDTGKTGWLLTISYLLGDRDTPEKAMRPALAAKFDSATLQIRAGGEEFTLQRRWKESGVKTKVFVGQEGLGSGEFSEWLLKKLDIPVLHYPKGNPWSGAT